MGAGATDSQRVLLNVSARIEPNGFAIVVPVRYTVLAMICGDAACFSLWRRDGAWITFVRAYLGAVYKGLVMIGAITVTFQKIIVPATRNRAAY
jgi:hypothetical protein